MNEKEKAKRFAQLHVKDPPYCSAMRGMQVAHNLF
jgi:hypothetical protein